MVQASSSFNICCNQQIAVAPQYVKLVATALLSNEIYLFIVASRQLGHYKESEKGVADHGLTCTVLILRYLNMMNT